MKRSNRFEEKWIVSIEHEIESFILRFYHSNEYFEIAAKEEVVKDNPDAEGKWHTDNIPAY